VSVGYRLSVGRASLAYRSSIDRHACWSRGRRYRPTYRPSVDRHIGRGSVEISIECQSIYWSSIDRHVGRYIDGEMSLVHKTRSVVRTPDRCTGGHGFDSRWELNFFCRHARDKLNISQSSLCGEFFRVKPGEDIFELLPILL